MTDYIYPYDTCMDQLNGREKERDRERERQTDRQTDRQRERESLPWKSNRSNHLCPPHGSMFVTGTSIICHRKHLFTFVQSL